MLYIENLYQPLFLDPMRKKIGNHLTIATGYASPNMVARHFKDLKDEGLNKEFSLELLIGMGNVGLNEHRMFKILMNEIYPNQFECYYAEKSNKFHSKVYQWSNDNEQKLSYMGSANYSQNGIIYPSQKEVLAILENKYNQKIGDYISELRNKSILCTNDDAIELTKKGSKTLAGPQLDTTVENGSEVELPELDNGMKGLRVSLLNKQGGTGNKSRINWGQRAGREPNQAYIAISTNAQRSGFFPPEKSHFILEDMNNRETVWLALMGGTGGKNLETHENNSIMGIYFRNKLNVPLGDKVLPEHYINYGKTYIDFYKVDDETYLFDF